MEIRSLAAIFNMLKQVLMFCMKLSHTLKNYNKDFVSTLMPWVAIRLTEFFL